MIASVSSRRLEILVVAGLVIADQITKALIRQSIELHESLPIIPDVLAFTRVHNTGAAFGMLNTMEFPGKTIVLTLVATLALVGVGWYAASVPMTDRLARLGVAMILGGAIGNLIDRVYAGYVLDFIDVYWGEWHFWAFNVADASISIGAVLVFVDLLLVKPHASNPV